MPKSLPYVEKAVKKANIKDAEFIIVNDGSTDNTLEIANDINLDFPLKVISQTNSGRYIARETGAKVAKFKYILYIDTRIYIDEKALQYVINQLKIDSSRQVWSAHVNMDKDSNIYARFWDAVVFIAWRKYFSNPRDYSYGIEEFDYYPKGTTCLFAPRDVIVDANKWFRDNTMDLKTSNDDTLLIRHIAESNSINISPKYSCIYHARGNLDQYLKHVNHRGRVFVDGFLRHDGNIYFWPLISFLLLSIVILFSIILFPILLIYLIILFCILWFIVLAWSIMLKMPKDDALSLFILFPLFVTSYGLGIWTAVIKIYIINNLTKGIHEK